MNPPTAGEIRALAALCSEAEWNMLLTHHGFISASTRTLAEMERVMTAALGRRISISVPSLANPSGDESL